MQTCLTGLIFHLQYFIQISSQNRQVNNNRIAPLLYYNQLNLERAEDKVSLCVFFFSPFLGIVSQDKV